MPESSSAGVQLAPDSTGKKVRTLEVTLLQSDGTTAVVEMQVISIADKTGAVLDFGNIEGVLERQCDLLEDILFELRLPNETQEE